MTVKLQVLISTCNDRLAAVPGMLHAQREDVSYIVVHQLFSETSGAALTDATAYLQSRPDVQLTVSASRGLSVSRNIALGLADAPYLLLADDDIQFTSDAFNTIINAMAQQADAAAITFRYCDANGQYRKSYPLVAGRRRWWNVFKVSSIEVCLRRDFIARYHIKFDPKFGLGAEYPVSEENILLSDILQSGGTITYLPADIAIHPNETSGANWDERYLRARGALFRRVFGIKGIGMLLLFFAKHSKTISKKLPLRQALKLTMIAFWDFV